MAERPQLEPVHVMEMERSTSRLELVRVNPTKCYATADGGTSFYTWQNGHWFDTGGNWIQDESVIPAAAKEDIRINPPSVKALPGTPDVTETCRFCGDTMNSSDIQQHMLEHINETLQLAGTMAPPADPVPPELPEKPAKRS